MKTLLNKKLVIAFTAVGVCIVINTANAQNKFPATGAAGIGTTSPNASSLLEVKSTTKGMLIPRMNLAQRNAIASPATGLMIYQTNPTPTTGFYYYDGSASAWKAISGVPYTAVYDGDGISVIGSSLGPKDGGFKLSDDLGHSAALGLASFNNAWMSGAVSGDIVLLNYKGKIHLGTGVSTGLPTMTISGSNVGIGTTSPGSRLELAAKYDGDGISVIGTSQIVGSGPKSAGFKLSDNLGHSAALGLASFHDAWMSGAASGDIVLINYHGKIHFGTGASTGSPTMTISGGNVGIGTLAPGYLLDVAGRMRVRNGNGTAGTWFMNAANTIDAGFVGMLSDSYIGLYGTGIGWGLIMNTTSGNVGIGTFNPTYKLSVNGTIQAKEVRVETGWSDYVFEDGYKLSSLDNVAEYIKQNKHLPGIPAAKEIQDNGLAVGEVQAKMMAKIEELTLYIIQLKKEVDTFKNNK